MALVDMKSNLVKEPDVYNQKSAFSDESINKQYDKFNLREESFNRSYIKEPYILHGIQKDGGTATTPFPLLTGLDHLADDVTRISKFMISPRGIRFITKQVGLQLMSPKVETPIGWPIPDIPNTRIYNLGVNTMAAVASPPLHPWIYIKRHGLLPTNQSMLNYGSVIKLNNLGDGNNNRLVKLTKKYMLSTGDQQNKINDDVRLNYYDKISDGQASNIPNNQFNINNILQQIPQVYMGAGVSGPMGPNSFFGVGETNMRFSSYRTPQFAGGQAGAEIERYTISKDPVQINKPLNEDNKTDFTKKLIEAVKHPINYGKSSPSSDEFRYSSLKYEDLKASGMYPDFRKNLEGDTKSFVGKEDYDQHHPGSFGMIDYKKSTKKDKSDYTAKDPDLTRDEINATYDKTKDKIDGVRDYITFRFSNFNATEHIIFRATITGLTDNFTPTWNSVNILGRADPAYIYLQFERTVSLNFKVAALSRGELVTNYKRLNDLAGYTTPEYSSHGMVAPFIRVTIGNYFLDTPAIITGLTYTTNDDSPWEINLENKPESPQLPHVIEVQLGLTIINNYRPEFGGKFFMVDPSIIPNPA